ncbi:hypothetical protein NDU88_002434, partial [Pleurodeles waltl]
RKEIWRAISQKVQTLGVHSRHSAHCCKRWKDLRRWVQKIAEVQLGLSSQRGQGACRSMTILRASILAVAYPDLDGCLRGAQQPQG